MNLSLFDELAHSQIHAFKLPTISEYDETDRRAPRVPKYNALKVVDFHNGIKDFQTTKRAFMSVEGPLVKKLPAVFRKKWFAELEDSVVPLYYLYDEFKSIAIEVEAASPGSTGHFGALNYILEHTKEQVLAYLLSCPIRAAKYDFAHGISREPATLWPQSHWSSQENQAIYLQALSELKSPTPTLFQRLTAGMKIRFASPLSFDYNGHRLKVADFQVMKDGKKLRFVSIEHGFVAKITGAESLAFTVI